MTTVGVTNSCHWPLTPAVHKFTAHRRLDAQLPAASHLSSFVCL